MQLFSQTKLRRLSSRDNSEYVYIAFRGALGASTVNADLSGTLAAHGKQARRYGELKRKVRER
jgi:hypothetical protein